VRTLMAITLRGACSELFIVETRVSTTLHGEILGSERDGILFMGNQGKSYYVI
jgi:hypothetical protein